MANKTKLKTVTITFTVDEAKLLPFSKSTTVRHTAKSIGEILAGCLTDPGCNIFDEETGAAVGDISVAVKRTL